MRLTYRDSTVPHTNAKGELWEAYSDANYNEVINKLTAYEDTGFEPEEVAQMGNALKLQSVMVNEASHYWNLQQQGLLVILPCKIGDMVYALWSVPTPTKYVTYLAEVKEIRIAKRASRTMLSVLIEPVEFRGRRKEYFADDFGKLVFRTEEDAEAALKGGTVDA